MQTDQPKDGLKSCPFCGNAGAGAWEKTVPGLGKAFTVFCHVCDGEGPPMVTEAEAIAAWNRRSREPSSSLVDDEDERGFTPSDYAHTAELLRSSEPIRKAAASNNHNIILAALDLCATRSPAHAGMKEALEELLWLLTAGPLDIAAKHGPDFNPDDVVVEAARVASAALNAAGGK